MRRSILATTALSAALALSSTASFAGPADNSLRWASDSMPSNIDFYQHTIREGIVLGHHIWDTLIYRNNATNEIEPHLAESFEWIDETTLEFKLRQGVKFHDGSDFTADDVVGTIEWITNNPIIVSVGAIAGAEKIDDYTVRITTKGVFPAALQYLANVVPIYPSDFYAEAGPEGMGRTPIGTGPYRVTEITPGEGMKMEKFDDYFGGVKGQPTIQSMDFRRISEFNTQAIEVMTGNLDWIWRVPPDALPQFASQPQLKADSGSTLRIAFVGMDAAGRTGETPLTNVDVRRALNHAINREGIREALAGPGSELLNIACSPEQFGCASDALVTYDYDPAKAKELLAAAGYPNGFQLEVTGYRDRPVIEAIIGDLAAVGITTSLNYLQASANIEARNAGKTAFFMQAWGSNSIQDADASTGYWYDGSAVDYARDETLIKLLDEAGATVDTAKREALYSEALGLISEQAYQIPLFTYALNYIYDARLNFTPVPDETPRFFEASWSE